MSTKKTMQRKNALGKGLSALLKDSFFLKEEKKSNSLQEIPIRQIRVNPFQPRKNFDAAALQELSASIQFHGIIQPLTVKQLTPSTYQLIAGERRLQAAKIAGLEKLPAYIRTADDQQMLEMALVENIQRENLNPIEIALSYQRLLNECQIKQEVLGNRVGKNRTTVTNYLRLLKLPPVIQVALRDQKISMGHARALVSVETIDTQLKIFKEIIKKDLSVRNVEALVRTWASEKKPEVNQSKQAENRIKDKTKKVSSRLATWLGTQVQIQVDAHEKGIIKIAFANTKELNRILNLLIG